jgi:hypothetical protein
VHNPIPTVVGVSGHRVLADAERIIAGIDAALDTIEAAFGGRPLWVLSALAEGADRIATQRVLARGGKLEAVLPLPRADYEADFATDVSRREFAALLREADRVVHLQPATSREEAYELGGKFVINNCEVLLAVWDGEAAQGRGGTGAIVRDARLRGLPMAWVKAGNRRPGTLVPTTLGAQQGSVVYERFPT